jgi:putative transposase
MRMVRFRGAGLQTGHAAFHGGVPRADVRPYCRENPAPRSALALVAFHRRRLPHWQPSDKPLFLTWHLHGSLPRHRFPPPASPSAGQAFVWMDRYLDQARSGPTWLIREEIAHVVVDAIQYAGSILGYCDLHAYVVMANHVHLLVEPRVSPSKFLQSVKGFSARQANWILNRSGQPLWQSESFDHWVRDERELERVRQYIENNPVRAGLVTQAEEYRWSSANGQNAATNGGMAGRRPAPLPQ